MEDKVVKAVTAALCEETKMKLKDEKELVVGFIKVDDAITLDDEDIRLYEALTPKNIQSGLGGGLYAMKKNLESFDIEDLTPISLTWGENGQGIADLISTFLAVDLDVDDQSLTIYLTHHLNDLNRAILDTMKTAQKQENLFVFVLWLDVEDIRFNKITAWNFSQSLQDLLTGNIHKT